MFDVKHLSIKCNCRINCVRILVAYIHLYTNTYSVYHSITYLIDLLLMALDQCLNTSKAHLLRHTCSFAFHHFGQWLMAIVYLLCKQTKTYTIARSHLFSFHWVQQWQKAHMCTPLSKCHFYYSIYIYIYS